MNKEEIIKEFEKEISNLYKMKTAINKKINNSIRRVRLLKFKLGGPE